MRALFIGSYPNKIEPYRSVFFRELIYEFAEIGLDCTVISCVSISNYGKNVATIPEYHQEKTPSGKFISVYHPRVITYSAKKIGTWNTIHLTQKSIEKAVMRKISKLNSLYDFVYGHFFLGGGLIAAKIGNKLNIPSYIAYGECNYNTEIKNKYGDIKKHELSSVKGIICVSSANQQDLEHKEFSKDIPTLVSNNSINPKVFCVKDTELCRKKFNIKESDFVIGFVGYFIERKGPNRVIQACKDMNHIKLAFVGKGEQKLIDDKIIFCRELVHDEIADFLNAVDVFVLPSLHEGCCNAVIEAMACGKPIISSNLPFNQDILNRTNSILINPNNIQEMRSAIIELINNDDLRKELASNALKDSQKLTIQNRAKNILKFIIETGDLNENSN